jgi:hypothetical protein
MNNIESILNSYFKGNRSEPFFAVIEKYPSFIGNNSKIIKISEFCISEDALPDMDEICEKITNNDDNENLVIEGLAEYLQFIKDIEKEKIMTRLKGIQGKAVFLCKGLKKYMEKFATDDPRFDGGRFCIFDSLESSYNDIKIVPENFPANKINGFKKLLQELENGKEYHYFSPCFLVTKQDLKSQKLEDSYDCIKDFQKDFKVPKHCGTNEQWANLLDNFKNNFLLYYPTNNFNDWMSFIASKQYGSKNGYLQLVLDKTEDFEKYKRNILDTILFYSHNEKDFEKLYKDRKSLLKEFKEFEIAEFVEESKRKGKDRVNYLTDSSLVEKKAILECGIAKNYPALENYMKPFDFKYKDYFERYKKQKLLGKVDEEFLQIVLQNSKSREYNQLPTRSEIFDKINSQNAKLYFIDALGVEFLAFIQNKCNECGLEINAKIARANLPSITRFNKDFYENWNGEKDDIKELDKIKHEGEKWHLADELGVINKILEKIATELNSHKFEKIIISSDHGASNLCVINGQELKYNVGSKGEHSGRCCPKSELAEKPENATEENDFWVLADYGRFKGGRKAMVEVHGGASLEEVVVPVIEISLAVKRIELTLEEKVIFSSFRTKPEIIIFSTTAFQRLSMKVGNKQYESQKLDENRHKFILESLKAGMHDAEILDQNNRIGFVKFEIRKEIAQEKELL